MNLEQLHNHLALNFRASRIAYKNGSPKGGWGNPKCQVKLERLDGTVKPNSNLAVIQDSSYGILLSFVIIVLRFTRILISDVVTTVCSIMMYCVSSDIAR